MTVVHGRHNRSVTLSFPTAPDAVELRHLRAFVAVAAELNFGRAAERLYITQPALSRQIRALEKALGCELLRRSTHRVELTLAGEAMLDRSHDVLRGVDEAVAAAQSVGGELAERVERLWAPLAGIDDLGELRTAYEALHAEFAPPPECAVRSVLANGVPSLAVIPPGARRAAALPARRRLRDGLRLRVPAPRRRAGDVGRDRRAGPGLPARARASVPGGARRRHARVPAYGRRRP